MIDVTNVDVVELVRKVYELSMPQGLGFLQYEAGGLTHEEAESIVKMGDRRCVVSMDYVRGRACKFVVLKNEDRLEIRDTWYDHTDKQFAELLNHFGLKKPEPIEHGTVCNCADCQAMRT